MPTASDYEGQNSFNVATIPVRYFWNGWLYRILGRSFVNFDSGPAASWTDFWWRGTSGEVGAFWYAYTSAWLPVSLLTSENQGRLVEAWLAASRRWPVSFHFNKGLAGAPAAAIAAVRRTATNPDVLDAFALAIVAAEGPPAFEGFPGPDLATADANRSRVQAAMAALRAAAPDTGTYVNECDYFQADWQRAFWGSNYPRLLEIKRRYDPAGLFFAHHGVGSEDWSADGFTFSSG
jgi:Berberine and berberine like